MDYDHEQPAIFLIQWGSDSELNEIEEIYAYFDADTLSPADMPSVRVTSPDTNDLWLGIQDLLADQRNAQLVYFSAHGKPGEVMFSTDGSVRISIGTLLDRISKALAVGDIHLLLGSCSAMRDFPQWAEQVPDRIRQVTGFWWDVDDVDVAALMASAVEADMSLLGDLSSYINANIQSIDEGQLDAIISRHADPTANVAEDGQLVASYSRNPQSPRDWNRKVWEVKAE